jgi:hypothetical protein
VQGNQEYNLEMWRSVFGDGLKHVVHNFVNGTTTVPEGTNQPWPCDPPSLWKDHFIGLDPDFSCGKDELLAVVFDESAPFSQP